MRRQVDVCVNGQPFVSESVGSVDEATKAAERFWGEFANAHPHHPPLRCAVCGTMGLFRVVSPGPPLDRLACAHCGAQRLEPSHGDTRERLDS